MVGVVSNAKTCAAVNGFLRSRFPKGTWSIAMLFNLAWACTATFRTCPST